ncbi:MAG: PIN domain-containing protein [Chloroflexota bacterium]
MPAKPRVLIDLNVILDVLQKREPFYETSARLLALVETGQADGYVAAHSMMTLFYLISKDRSVADARAVLTSLLQFLKVASIDHSAIERALTLDYRDYEDAVQMIVALQLKLDCIVTRNVKDYSPALLPVLQPVEFLANL